MDFRARLLATLHRLAPLFEEDGVMVVGSEVPNLDAEGVEVPLPRPAGLLLEKLATERSGEKGDRDLLVALGLLLVAAPADLAETAERYRSLVPEIRHTIRSNLATLSLLEPRAAMPDPRPHRELVAALLDRLERREAAR